MIFFFKKKKAIRAFKDLEKVEFSFIVGTNIEWYCPFRKQLGSFI